MSSRLLQTPAVLDAKPRPRAVLPSFGILATAGFSVNAPFLALAFLSGKTWLGVSLLGGYGLGLIVYGLLYLTVTGGPLPAKPQGRRLPANFALFLAGKFLVFGAALFLLLCVLKVGAIPMLVGLLTTQAGVTAAVMKHLKMTKVTD